MPEDNGRSGEGEGLQRKRRPPLVTRDHAIETAYRLVDAEGPPGLSMRRLAAALHVSLPTVYTAIDSREALVERLLDRLLDEIATGLALDGTTSGGAPDAPPDTNEGDELRRCGLALLDWCRARPNLTTFLLAEEIGPGVAERVVRSATPARRAAALALLQAVAGAGSSVVDPVVVVMVIVAEGRAALWLGRQDRLASIAPERWIELGCDNVARALRAMVDVGSARRG
jgi:AcrR family transcriptional regulator